MNEKDLIALLNRVKSGEEDLVKAAEKIKMLPFKDIDFAKLDNHRALRQGFTEAVYSPGKRPEQIVEIMKELRKHNPIVLATRISKEAANTVQANLTDSIYYEDAKILAYGNNPDPITKNYVLVVTAGTVDIPVAKEAIITIKSNGVEVKELYDCGVAGAHRLFKHVDLIQGAKCIVAVAGMEGALASLVGGISPCPVIAVPTSHGYGSHLQGLAPLLSMLNSCSSCVSVVNIDNGYGAGTIASMIIRQSQPIKD